MASSLYSLLFACFDVLFLGMYLGKGDENEK